MDADDVRAVDEAVEHLALLQVGGDEHVALQPGSGGVGRDGVRQVAGGGAGDDLEAEFLRAGQRDGDDAIFKREGGVIEGVVLDVEFLDAERLGQPVGLHQGGEAGLESHGGFAIDREQFPVAPHIVGARFNDMPGNGMLDLVVVVIGFERAEIEFADVDGFLRVLTATLATLEITEKFFAHSFHR